MRSIFSSILIAMTFTASAALAQGYSGVFADDPDAPQQQTAPAPAPAPDTAQQTVPQDNNVAGQEQTSIPGRQPLPQIKTKEQIINQATAAAQARNNQIKLAGEPWLNDGHREHVDGKLPMEYSLIQLVQNYKRLIENPNQTAEKRKENATLVYKKLSEHLGVLQQQLFIPVEAYKKSGTPDLYIKEQKESLSRGISTLKKAIEEVKTYL